MMHLANKAYKFTVNQREVPYLASGLTQRIPVFLQVNIQDSGSASLTIIIYKFHQD